MAKFNSGEVIEALDYDLTAHAGPLGTVPEPTDAAIIRLYKRVREEVTKEIEAFGVTLQEDVQSPEALLELMGSFDEEKVLKASEIMIDIFAELCAGSPTKPQLVALPFRVRNAFFAWLMGELNPPGSSAGTMPSLRVVPGASDGISPGGTSS
jgi:hypothetical protein